MKCKFCGGNYIEKPIPTSNIDNRINTDQQTLARYRSALEEIARERVIHGPSRKHIDGSRWAFQICANIANEALEKSE